MPLLESSNISESFKSYFEIVPALSEALKNEAYLLRHQVYCEELKYESIRSNKLEIDKYDSHALHLLIRNIQTNEFIGCTRIIRPRLETPNCLLPFEELCAAVLDRSVIDPLQLPRQSIGEVSRLSVISRYRRRKGESNRTINISEEDYGNLTQPRFPYIPIALYFSTVELARINGIDHLFCLTESRLASHFRKLVGENIQVIGNSINHHGERVPSVLYVNQILNNMRSFIRPLYRVISADIKKHISNTK